MACMTKLHRLAARRSTGSRAGQTMIEFALVLPVLLLIIAGITDFGRAYMLVQVLTNAAMEGARVGILPGKTMDDVNAAVTQVLDSSNVTASNIAISGASAAASPGTQVSVAVTADFDYLMGRIIPETLGVPTTFPLTQTAVMRHE